MTQVIGAQTDKAFTGFVIEFIGLPGVGKTTLAHEVLALLTPFLPVTLAYTLTRDKPWLVRRFHSTRNILHFACSEPRYALHSGQMIRASRQRSRYDALKVTNNWLSVSADTVQAQRTPGVWLSDQGMFQALWSVGYSARGRDRYEQLQALCAAMPKPNLLVLLYAEQPAILRRLRTRGGKASRLDVEADVGGVAQLPKAAELLAQIAELARTSAAVKLLELDATYDGVLAFNAQRVADTVCEVLMPDKVSPDEHQHSLQLFYRGRKPVGGAL